MAFPPAFTRRRCRRDPSAQSAIKEAAAQAAVAQAIYCADDRVEISFWGLEQKVRRGSDVCQMASYTSYSDAIRFARRTFAARGRTAVASDSGRMQSARRAFSNLSRPSIGKSASILEECFGFGR
jgi:hypothetical protein